MEQRSIEIVTLFPEIFESFLRSSLVGKAVEAGILRVHFTNPRDFTQDRHRSVDDAPYGGGVGMVMRAPPIVAAVEAAVQARGPAHRILLTPAGRPVGQARVRELAAMPRLLLVCGRYEGIDDRVRELVIDEEISIGDFVLQGGEAAAICLIEAVSRLVPGVIGDAASTEEESFSAGLLEFPQYTRPPEFRGHRVPEVLTGGDHAKIAAWRREASERRTRERRPDLWSRRTPAGPPPAPTYVALVHHPVMDRNGRIVTTAVTNLDIHDIARASRTFGVSGYFLVTPIDAQRELISRIVGHWTEGEGREHNDKRSDALEGVEVARSLDEVRSEIAARHGQPPWVVLTTARRREGALSFEEVRARAVENFPILLVFGTGWGLAEEVFGQADAVLAPIRGAGDYNHLSVRSAVAIVLDRLFGRV